MDKFQWKITEDSLMPFDFFNGPHQYKPEVVEAFRDSFDVLDDLKKLAEERDEKILVSYRHTGERDLYLVNIEAETDEFTAIAKRFIAENYLAKIPFKYYQ